MATSTFLFAYCPQTLYGAGCSDPTCSLIHDAKYCDVCGVICQPAATYSTHISSQSHIKRVSNTRWLHCPICRVSVIGQHIWDSHVNGRLHLKTAKSRSVDPKLVQPTEPPLVTPGMRRCETCNVHIPDHNWTSHLSSRAHRNLEQHAAFRAAFELASHDKHGVSVSHAESGLDFGIVEVAEASRGLQGRLAISTDDHTSTTVVSANFIRSKSGNKHTFRVDFESARALRPGETVDLPVLLETTRRGHYGEQVAIMFRESSGNTFRIVRRVKAVVGDAADHEALKPVTPYVNRRRAPWRHGLPTMSGERPPSLLAAQWVKRLPKSHIPLKLAEILQSGSPADIASHVQEKYFSDPMNLNTHNLIFARLLWVEEHRTAEDMRRYDMIDVRFAKEGRLYTLQVPGLAEKRPSVMIGDAIKVQAADGTEGRTHEGFVHDVQMETIRVSFHGSFQAEGRRYNVSFQLNRVPLRRQHQALNSSLPNPGRLLFPDPGQEGLERPLGFNEDPVDLFNALISTNPAQLQAVKSILRLRQGAAPFIIFGPPGTGKTVTAVEAIRQILLRNPDARILACAPSNSAADIIAMRLDALTPEELFRCNAASRDPASVPEALVPYTLRMTSHYAIPPLDTLKKYRVIVSTCGNASFAYNVGMERGHFTHIFVDEAGQATEPEVLTAIKTMSSEETRIVLSGDPKQLGPIVRSSIARDHGLGVSYMERLIERGVYDAQHRRTSWIKLLQNYRSHASILAYPNEKFYEGELEVCGDHATTHSFVGSPQLESPKFPIVFHAIAGHNDRESTSPSYFNIDEASEVKAYVQALLNDRNFPIQARDIGVITPYHAQVRKIRKLLRDTGFGDVDVGSVEIFQGQERRAIIISTVRSSADLLAYDAKFTLGFVSNPRRFNVAVSRAQALLIVVGDASILSVDPIWRGFMNYVYLHGGWRGDAPTWDANAPVQADGDYADELQEALAADMSAFMAGLSINGGEAGGEDLEGDANVDRPFVEAD
ncbi:P-loop containing nucleoside triphosphate hydrolase protein [Lentinus tigrinus ALCF2SS1-7]|uniref:P-loop containing nucleoside triphosphate hydrolase protein n=1 Tax=Lentinus tigrinus ALCF2SS1-6 TaxID=1328759 RepID=A0A5C2RV15_9APHY|nr:P-loop containing nucleoside triphosphate hydrolase protein [Lentinus tigrinus ALCF2SS1-6]RPD72505.1 P-loop containing nucleoside triphosphate hydrolase protein [Lentinus tigrinus ALCF2SS1-7]